MKPYQDKKQLFELLQKYRSYKATAKFLNVNPKTITSWARKFNLPCIGTQGARRHFLNEHYFKIVDSEEKAYWLGFLMADGCVYKGSDKNSYRLQINLKSTDNECLNKFNRALNSDYPVNIKKIKNKKTKKEYEVAQLKINSTIMCEDLMRLGVTPKKSLVCKMPDIDKNLLNHYLRGYFDGDGCITKDKINRWTASIVGGENMLNIFKDYLAENNIVSSIYKINHSKAQSLEISNRISVNEFGNLIYNNATVFYKRKYNRFQVLKKYLSRQSEMTGQ